MSDHDKSDVQDMIRYADTIRGNGKPGAVRDRLGPCKTKAPDHEATILAHMARVEAEEKKRAKR